MGYRDIYASRRTAFMKCDYWRRTDANGTVPLYKMAYEVNPDGWFYAEEAGYESEQVGQSGSIQYTSNTVTIQTTDDIIGKLHRNDLVCYDRKIYRVDSIRLAKDWRRSEFSRKNKSGIKIIVLRG